MAKLFSKILIGLVIVGGFLLALNYVIDHKTDDEIKSMLRKSIQKAFSNFQVKYNKSYKDEAEEKYRYSIFANNYVQIYRHNKFLVFSSVGVNQFADLTDEEFKALFTGHKHDNDDSSNDGQTHAPLPTDNLPLSFDWREKGAITPVKSQSNFYNSIFVYFSIKKIFFYADISYIYFCQQYFLYQNKDGCGGCWAFSTVQSIESLHFLKTGKLEIFSTQQVIDCCRINESGCLGGDPEPAYKCLQDLGGIMKEADYPFISKQQKKCDFDEKKETFKITGYVNVPSDQSQVKAALLKQPLSICLNSSDTSFKYYTKGVITECEDGPNDGPDHCLSLVGYGHDEDKKVDYWLVKNQWETSWGENVKYQIMVYDGGYVRIQRDDNDKKGPGKCFVVAEVRYPISDVSISSPL